MNCLITSHEPIFNYRQEDIGKYIKIESNGWLSCISHVNKSRFDFL